MPWKDVDEKRTPMTFCTLDACASARGARCQAGRLILAVCAVGVPIFVGLSGGQVRGRDKAGTGV